MGKTQLKLSVIVPVYNGESTFSRCIDSILAQTLTDLELIVIDDGSTDGTEQICRSCQDPRLVYHRKENGGVSSARNLGISLARGEYVGFVDADDYISPDMYEKMYAAASEKGADICVCDYNIFKPTGQTTYSDLLRSGYFDRSQMQQEVLPAFFGVISPEGDICHQDWCVWRRLFRRSMLAENGLQFDETLYNSEDGLFSYQATECADSIVYLKNQFLYQYQLTANSLTRKYLSAYWQQRCHFIDALEAVISRTQPAWDTPGFVLMVMRGVRPSFTNIAYGFGQNSMFHSLMEFRTIVNDPRVRKMCAAVNPEGFNDEWSKLFNWCYHKRWITLYLYHMDVIQHNKLCHQIRRVQKALERRLHR